MTVFQTGLAWGGKVWACAYIQGVVTQTGSKWNQAINVLFRSQSRDQDEF